MNKLSLKFTLKQKNFTLVELLVVIAIISVLAGMLLPALQNALAVSRQITCLNNQKQLYLGVIMYVDDYSGILPRVEGWTDQQHVGGYISGGASVKSGAAQRGGVYYCPSDVYPLTLPLVDQWVWTASYATVEDLTGSDWRGRDVRLTAIRRPGLRVLFIEQKPVPSVGYRSHWTVSSTSWNRRDLRHSGGHNICHFDGAARYYPDPLLLEEWTGGLTTPGDWRYGIGLPSGRCLKAYSMYYPVTITEAWMGCGTD